MKLRTLAQALIAVGLAIAVVGVVGTLTSGEDGDGGRNDVDFAATTNTTRPSTSTTARPTTTQASERPEDFARDFAAAIREHDEAYLADHLHPIVLDRYGEAECDVYLADFADPTFEITIDAVAGPASWSWQTDGVTTEVEDVYTLQGARNGDPAEFHFGVADGSVRWFTDCGDPRPSG